jgi:hypothetical protein
VKSGSIHFKVVDKKTNTLIPIKLDDYLTKKQQNSLKTKPDFIWQFVQRLKQKFEAEGKSVAIYATSYVSVNGKPLQRFVNPEIDLTTVAWHPLKHSEWLLPSK